MKKKLIGIIYLLYSSIIIYLLITNKLKNFLAPQMQIYIKVLVIPLIIIGIVMLFNKKEYKVKITDIILLLPLVLLIFSGNNKLTTSFANNRVLNTNYSNRVKSTKTEEVIEEIVEENIVFEPDFIIEDTNYESLASYLTFSPKAINYKDKMIKVKGFILKQEDYLQKGYYSIGKYVISCCAADAEYTGFIVKENNFKVKENKWYDIEGILKQGQDKLGYDIMYIEIINIKEISSNEEEQYVYPCYIYDEKCSSLVKYDLK